MSDSHSDRVAHEAARLFDVGAVGTVREALRAAVERLGPVDPPITEGRVRQHIQAMQMQRLGEAGYRASVIHIYESVEQLMATVELIDPDAWCVLVGRPARGDVDGSTAIYVRVYTGFDVERLADRLVSLGYDEPSFETINSRLGRLNRLRLTDGGVELVLTRCPERTRQSAGTNLFTGRPTHTMTREEVGRHLAALR